MYKTRTTAPTYDVTATPLTNGCHNNDMIQLGLPPSSVRVVGGGGLGDLTPHWSMTPPLVTAKSGLGVGFDPSEMSKI